MAAVSEKKKVLIVDDEEDIVQLLKEILNDAVYEPIGVTRWTDAVESIGKGEPDVILLDLKMPTIDGPALLEFIRGQGMDTPVIVVSGFVTQSVANDLSRFGVSAFVHKPFKASEILNQVERALNSPRGGTPASSAPQGARMDSLFTLNTTQPSSENLSGPRENDEADILEALARLSSRGPNRPTPPAQGSAPVQQAPPEQTPPEPTLPQQPEQGPTPEPAAQTPPPFDSGPPPPPGLSPGRTDGHGRPHSHRRRRRTFTRRNLLLFGAMTVACMAIAGFLAAVQWYAGQVDIADLQEKSRQTMNKQAADEILRELKQNSDQ